MMINIQVSKNQSNNFDLKAQYADLAPASARAALSLKDLEARRVSGSTLTASKYGLEVICGASCETGAQ
jgi:hypothetical protein